MKSTRRLTLERLEERTVPSATTLWPDAPHLTLSFVPDGTYAADGPSNLFHSMTSQDSPAVWEQTILRAFQTWAVNSNINIGVVPDDGSPLGTTGAFQGDPRFGDIRIAGEPMPSTAVAITAFVEPGSTWSGDMVLNTNYSFGAGAGQYDLFSVALHEAGHDFGLPDSNDPNSVEYQPYRHYTGLTPTDLQLLQANYGVSPQASGHETLQTAAPLSPSANTSTLFTAAGDITTNTDVNYYSIRTGSGVSANGADFRLHTQGLSLFTGRLTVYDANGNALAASAATDPLNNDVLIHLSSVRANTTYYVRVQSATADVFGIGAYQLTVNLAPQAPVSGKTAGPPTATSLPVVGLVLGSNTITTYGAINSTNTASAYQITTQLLGNYAAGMNVSLQEWGLGVLPSTVSVYDGSWNLMATATAADPVNGNVWLHVGGIAPARTYYVVVWSGVRDSTGIGAYQLQVDLHPASTTPPATTAPTPNLAPKSNNVLGAVLSLLSIGAYTTLSKYEAIGNLASGTDVNTYHITGMQAGAGKTSTMTVTVIAQDAAALAPRVAVFDSHGNQVAATVLTNAKGAFVVQIANVVSGADYYIKVTTAARAGAANAGNYFVSIDDFLQAAVALQTVASDTLTQTSPQEYRTLTVAQDQLFNFVLSADVGAAVTPAAVQMNIYDANGNLVFSMVAYSGQPPSTGMVYLGAGTYTVRFSASAKGGAALPPLNFTLAAQVLTDPMGPRPMNPDNNASGSPSGGSPSGGSTSGGSTTTTSGSTYTMTSPSSPPAAGPAAPTSNPYYYY